MATVPTPNQTLISQDKPAIIPSQDDPFGGVKGAVSAVSIQSTIRIKAAILGLPKSGKSWFAATAPKPIMYYDFDDRAQSLAGKDGLMIKTLVDTSQSAPIAMKEIEKDLSNFKYRKMKNLPIPATFVLDTITFMKNCIENEIFAQDPGLVRKIKVGSTTSILKGKTYDTVVGVQKYLEYLISEYAALGNIIVIFHERDQKDKGESTATETKYTGKITVDPQYLENLLTMFNEVFRIQVKGGLGGAAPKYEVTCRANNDVNAATTLLIDATEPPDFMQMLNKHKAALAARK